MNFDHPALRILVTGKSGSGKSTLVRSLVARSKARWLFAFDTFKREFSRFLGWQLAYDEPTLKAALVASRRSAFDSAPLFPGDRPEGFAFWCRWVYNVGRTLPGVKLVVVEELEKTADNRHCEPPRAFLEMLDEGRVAQFDVILVAQRVSTTHCLVRGQITEMVSFIHTSANELDWLEREGGFNREAVSSLKKPGGYIWRNLDTDEERTNPRADTSRKASRRAVPQG